MSGRGQPRVLGAQRTVSDALGERVRNDVEIHAFINHICSTDVDVTLTLQQLEGVLAYCANHNSECTRAGEDDVLVLMGEILNNSIRSVMLFGTYSPAFTDVEMYSISIAMQYNLSIEAITINGVNVGDEVVSMLCEALIKSRVSFVDFSHIPLNDEAGASLAALAQINPYVRTVVVNDTLISEEVLDQIDLACQFNQSNFEENSDKVEINDPAELASLRGRVLRIIRDKRKGIFYCPAYVLGMCSNGDFCPYSHSPMISGPPDANSNLHERLAILFAEGKNWQEKLPQPPREGPSWKDPSEQNGHGLRLNLAKRRSAAAARQKGKSIADTNTHDGASVWRVSLALSVCVAVLAAAMLAVRSCKGLRLQGS